MDRLRLLSNPQVQITPDGARYRAMAIGRRLPVPFNLRWLVPALCGRDVVRWRLVAWTSVLVTAAATGYLAGGWQRGIAAALIVLALPISRFNLRYPILVDAPAMAFALVAATAWQEGAWWLGLPMILVSGATKETGPVFGALYAWNPVLLVGLLAPLVRRLVSRPGPDVLDAEHAWILQHPVLAARKYHAGHWLDGLWMLTPWGGAIVGLAALDWQLGACLVIAYAQLLVATDTVRLYQWAAPLLVVAAVGAVPIAWLPLLVLVTIFNPWGGHGA